MKGDSRGPRGQRVTCGRCKMGDGWMLSCDDYDSMTTYLKRPICHPLKPAIMSNLVFVSVFAICRPLAGGGGWEDWDDCP